MLLNWQAPRHPCVFIERAHEIGCLQVGCLQTCRHPQSGACRRAGTLQAPKRYPAGTRDRMPGACRHPAGTQQAPGVGCRVPAEPGRHPAGTRDRLPGACRRPAGTQQAPGIASRVPAGTSRHPAGTRDRVPGACRHQRAPSRHPESGAGCLQAPAGTQQAPGVGCRVPAGTLQAPSRHPGSGAGCLRAPCRHPAGIRDREPVFKVVRKEEKVLSSSHVTVAHCLCLKTPPYCDVQGRRERARGEHKGTCPPSLDKINFTR